MLTHYVCVCLLCVCVYLCRVGRGVRGGWTADELGGLVFGPHLPGSSLCSRNLSSSLLRQWEEHVRLWHMVARVTCSLCLALNFWPSEQNLPTLTTPASLHLPPCSLSTLYSAPPFILHSPVLPRIVSAWQVCVLHAATLYFSCLCTCVPYFYFSLSHKSSSLTRHWVKLSSTEFLSFFFLFVFACLPSVSPDKRPSRPPPSDLHPSTVHRWTPPSTSQANLTFKSPTHIYWTAVLSPVQIWKRARDGEREGGKEWNGKISPPLVTGWGAAKNTAQLSKPP